MARRINVEKVLIGALAVFIGGVQLVPGAEKLGPVSQAAAAVVTGNVTASTTAKPDSAAAQPKSALSMQLETALSALAPQVRKLSHPDALSDAFKSYFEYKTEHPDAVKKPYLYFVDYGLAATEPRGYVFDMSSLTIVDGPFTVAHGRGSSVDKYGVPTKFGNGSGSARTSLGLYVTQSLYPFTGHTGGSTYSSIGLRLEGLSKGFNDLAFARGVVAHGAPYVTASKAGRSEGCPAMEPARAKKLLPMLANGAMVFLFAPDANWLANDQWVTANVG
jgi:hypothetical protein